MKHRITRLALFSLVTGLIPLTGHAASYGPFTTADGRPARFRNQLPITYSVDQGDLSPTVNHAQAKEMVRKAFDQWQGVNTARIAFEELTDPDTAKVVELENDVTAANAGSFFGGLPPDFSPIIFDQNGGVIDLIYGQGASLSVYTVGTPLNGPSPIPESVTPTGTITQGMIILNGRMTDGLADPDDPSAEEMDRAIVRAVGSFLNLGSSDLNDELRFDGNVANNNAVPIMYSTINNPAATIPAVIGGGSTLTLDDRMSVSRLYPASTLAANTALIRGRVTLADGTTGLQGIAVIARKTDDPLNSAVEAISGELFRNFITGRGSRELAQIGNFEMRVPPGTYTIEYRPLRQPIGPLGRVSELPGGAVYYQAAPGSTAGPDPATATPVTVAAGQELELVLKAGGTAAPAPQSITEAEPNDDITQIVDIPGSATIVGNIKPNDRAVARLFTGSGSRDGIEDFYRLVLSERSVVTTSLQPKEQVDFDLYIFGTFPVISDDNQNIVDAAAVGGNIPEVTQRVLGPGIYYLGVSLWDNDPSPDRANEYTLTVNVSPVGQVPAEARPVLNQLVVGNITTNSAEVSWITDLDATADVVVGPRRQQFGDATAAKTHRVAVTGLVEGAFNRLLAVSQVPGALRDSIPEIWAHTANPTAVEGPARLNAAMFSQITDTVTLNGVEQTTRLVAIAIQNPGGAASNVQVRELTTTPGWKLAQPLTEPINVGAVGSGAVAVVVVRVVRDGAGTDPALRVTGTGTVAGADGAAVEFRIGP